jgi:hypothetical protein
MLYSFFFLSCFFLFLYHEYVEKMSTLYYSEKSVGFVDFRPYLQMLDNFNVAKTQIFTGYQEEVMEEVFQGK